MTDHPRLARRTALAATAALGTPARAQPAAWPTGPIRFVGIFPPGGGTDILSRIWCQKMGEITGQQFVVENRSGSGGNVGTEVIARATPDGNTIGLASVSSLAISPTLYRRLPFDVTRDFSYVSGLWQLPNMLVVNNDVPARTVPELIALCRANPGRYTFASSGSGTSVHLSGEMFKHLAGIDIVHVPFRGAAPAVTEVLAGRIDILLADVPALLSHVRSGTLRALAVTSRDRIALLPDVPTMQQAGVPDMVSETWYGLLAPAATPPDRIATLSRALTAALTDSETLRALGEQGGTVRSGSPEQFGAFIRANYGAWAEVIRVGNIRPE